MRKLTLADVRAGFAAKGAVLLSDSYERNTTRLTFTCACGRTSETTWMSFRVSGGCTGCRADKATSATRASAEDVAAEFAAAGCELLSNEYENANSPLADRCACGAEATIALKHFRKGVRCKACGWRKQARAGEDNPNWTPRTEAYVRGKLFARMCREAVRGTLAGFGLPKAGRKTQDWMGYSPQDLEERLAPGMERGLTEPSLDHVFPIQAFVDYGLTGREHVALANALDNLQVIERKANSAKRDRYDPLAFEDFLMRHGVTP